MVDFYIVDVVDKLGLTSPYYNKWVFGSSVVSLDEYNHGVYVGKSCALGLACKVAINLMLRNYSSNFEPCHIYMSCARPPTDVYAHEVLMLAHLVQLQIGRVTLKVSETLHSTVAWPKEIEINIVKN